MEQPDKTLRLDLTRRWAAPVLIDPKNELEVLLVNYHEGKVDEKTFLSRLLHLTVYIATDNLEAAEQARSLSPVVLHWNDRDYLAVFSLVDRVDTLIHEGGGSVQMLFKEVLDQVPEGMGIVLNPNFGVALDFPPAKIVEMRELLRDFERT
ncbi:MAG: SseB family protein [Nitrospirae bacterium]|nr:SseB family protein [Nitrospirota bacterium]